MKDEICDSLAAGAQRRPCHDGWRRPLLRHHGRQDPHLAAKTLTEQSTQHGDDAKADRAHVDRDSRVVLCDVDADERKQKRQENDHDGTPDGVRDSALDLAPELDHGA